MKYWQRSCSNLNRLVSAPIFFLFFTLHLSYIYLNTTGNQSPIWIDRMAQWASSTEWPSSTEWHGTRYEWTLYCTPLGLMFGDAAKCYLVTALIMYWSVSIVFNSIREKGHCLACIQVFHCVLKIQTPFSINNKRVITA